jgi:hypothetical protein
MKAYVGVDVQIYIFLDSTLAAGEFSASRPGRFTPGEPPPPAIHWIVGWVDPRAGLDDVEQRKFLTLQGLELRPLGRSAHIQSLCQLHYPGSHLRTNIDLNHEHSKQTVVRTLRDLWFRSHDCKDYDLLVCDAVHCGAYITLYGVISQKKVIFY